MLVHSCILLGRHSFCLSFYPRGHQALLSWVSFLFPSSARLRSQNKLWICNLPDFFSLKVYQQFLLVRLFVFGLLCHSGSLPSTSASGHVFKRYFVTRGLARNKVWTNDKLFLNFSEVVIKLPNLKSEDFEFLSSLTLFPRFLSNLGLGLSSGHCLQWYKPHATV